MLSLLLAATVVSSHAACATLRNRDIFSTVEVKVGTPAQHLELVADTGSNTLIVQSCACQALGSCPSSFGRCFRGWGKSSSFFLPRDGPKDSPEVWILKYGSGDIEALVASDRVSIGNYTAEMNSSLLLMVSQALDFDTSFEGILGLGLPNLTAKVKSERRVLHTFLDVSSIQRFAICFNLGADGVLLLDEPSPQLLRSFTEAHWALKLHSARVGHESLKLEDHLAIPDSGTTLITGPLQEVAHLLEAICEEWPRCKQAKEELLVAFAQREVVEGPNKERVGRLLAAFQTSEEKPSGGGALALQMLLEDCGAWKHQVDLDAEMPAIRFQLQGADGSKQEVAVKASSYVAEVSSTAMVWSQKYLLGILPYWWPEVEQESSCAPLLGSAPYVGQQLWILGTPLFYSRQVHFDLGAPGIGFTEGACGTCEKGHVTSDPALLQGPKMRRLSRPGRVR